MHFVAAGGGAPPLVFVHGFSCEHSDWRPQLAHFAQRHRVVACDLRGHGATPGRAQECSIEHYGGDVAALLANLELSKAVLVGHSMGCRVVLEAVRLDPERVAGLVLIDGSRSAAIAPPGPPNAAFVEPLVRGMFFSPSAEAERIVARALRMPADVATALWQNLTRWDVERMEGALEALRAPVMAIQSTYLNAERKRVPLKAGESTPWLDFLREKRPAARVAILPGIGHFTQLEAPEALNRLIDDFVSSFSS